MVAGNKGKAKRKKQRIIGQGKLGSGIPNLSSNKPLPDRELDFSDIPEATDEQLLRARRIGTRANSNTKRWVGIRIAPYLLAKLRLLAVKHSKPFQTYIAEILERAARKKVA